MSSVQIYVFNVAVSTEWVQNGLKTHQGSVIVKKKKKKNLNEEELFISTFWSSDT